MGMYVAQVRKSRCSAFALLGLGVVMFHQVQKEARVQMFKQTLNRERGLSKELAELSKLQRRITTLQHLVLKSRPGAALYDHVVFSTFKGGGHIELVAAGNRSNAAITGLRQQVEANMRQSWEVLGVRTIWFGDDKVETNEHGTPVLKAMYLQAFRMYPGADTYTYVNGDLLTDHGFVHTADAVVSAVRSEVLPPGFLVVGKRTNVDWVGKTIHAPEDFDKHMGEGKLFQNDAQDYFIVSKHTFDWRREIPPFVIGRPAYDNWLVNRAYHDSTVALIDATRSIRVIHQTDHQGNWVAQQHKPAGYTHNYELADKKWDHGTTDHAEYETVETDAATGEIGLFHKTCNHPSSDYATCTTQHMIVSRYIPGIPVNVKSAPLAKT
jgi:hypothetical protein